MTTELALRTGALAEAKARAADGYDWISIATAYARRGDRDEARECLARASGDITITRNVARMHHLELDDRDAACRVLAEHGARMFEDGGTAREWFLLAAAWDERGERDTARDYLAHARAEARSVGDWCDVVLGYKLVGEATLARELLLAAEPRDAGERLTIVNAALFVLEDPELAETLLEQACEQVGAEREIDRLLLAYARLFPADSEAAEVQLRSHERRAQNVDDWIALGRAWQSIVFDIEEASRCFERARDLATDEDARMRVRIARDDEDPDPRPPSILLPRRDALGYACDPARLFDFLRARMSKDQLRALADNDYVEGVREYPVFVEICESGLVPRPLPFNMQENVALERWGHGDDHTSFAFACVMLCFSPGNIGGDNESMAVLLDSCCVLGDEAMAGLVGLFAAMEDDLFIALGLVLAAARRDPSDPWLEPAIARLVAMDRHHNERAYAGGFVFGSSNFDQRYELWRELADAILEHPIPHLAVLRERLKA
jgi:hypothetical protein